MNKKLLPTALCVAGGLIAALTNIILLPISDGLGDWVVIAPPIIGLLLIIAGVFMMARDKKNNP